MTEPKLIDGDVITDDRGNVQFVNGFSFDDVKRFYIVSNHNVGFVRAWHAHRREGKYVTVTRGAALVGAVRIEDWAEPNRESHVYRFVLSASKPTMLCIPPGYANGFMSLTHDTQLLFFSTASLAETREDDVRYDARYWDIWTIVER